MSEYAARYIAIVPVMQCTGEDHVDSLCMRLERNLKKGAVSGKFQPLPQTYLKHYDSAMGGTPDECILKPTIIVWFVDV